MKKLLTLLLLLIYSTAFSQDIEKAKEHISIALEALNDVTEQEIVKNVQVQWTDEKLFLVKWEAVRNDALIDIQFYDPVKHREWQLSVLKYNDGQILSGKEQHPIKLGNSDTDQHDWKIRIITADTSWASEPVPLLKREAQKNTSKLIPIETSEKKGSEYFRNDFYGGSITGYIYHKGKYRIYYQNRAVRDSNGDYTIEMVESADLEKWSKPQKTDLKAEERLLTVNGEVHCWIPDGRQAFIYTDFDTYEGCDDRSHKVIENWKIDGTLGPNHLNGKYMQLGRVRGWDDNDKGGWENDLADYPDPEWYPNLVEAYEEQYPDFDIRRNLHDRRGVSLHTGEGKNIWNGEIIVDPENVELPGFLGWEFKDKDGIADFYSGTFVDEERVLLKVYWKKSDRLVDRANRPGHSSINNPQRRFRFTGETTVIAARLLNGEIQFSSFESVFPYDHFKRKAHSDVSWATCPNCLEVGQFTQAANVMYLNGYAYLPFSYRDDVHYESANNLYDDGLIRHLTGIYMYRVPEGEFNSWWK